jgi:hypothetical protein
MSHIFNDARQDGYNDNGKNDKGKVLSNNGQVAEKISRKGANQNPCDSSYDIVAYEAPKGAKVLIIGTKRAMIIVLPPYFS